MSLLSVHPFLFLSGVFYSVLCIFSLVTGLIYMSGKRELNPLELSDRTLSKLSDPGKKKAFAKKMGLVTFIVGIVQGLTALAIFLHKGMSSYALALSFTLFSIASVSFKLKGRISSFALIKAFFYISILIILLLHRSRSLFF